MIETFFGLDALGTPQAFFAAFAIGLAFGLILETSRIWQFTTTGRDILLSRHGGR